MKYIHTFNESGKRFKQIRHDLREALPSKDELRNFYLKILENINPLMDKIGISSFDIEFLYNSMKTEVDKKSAICKTVCGKTFKYPSGLEGKIKFLNDLISRELVDHDYGVNLLLKRVYICLEVTPGNISVDIVCNVAFDYMTVFPGNYINIVETLFPVVNIDKNYLVTKEDTYIVMERALNLLSKEINDEKYINDTIDNIGFYKKRLEDSILNNLSDNMSSVSILDKYPNAKECLLKRAGDSSLDSAFIMDDMGF